MNIRLAQAAVSQIPGNSIEEKISWLQSRRKDILATITS